MSTPDHKNVAISPLRPGLDRSLLTARELIDLPQYALVREVERRFHERRQSDVVEIFQILAASSFERAALTLSDLHGLTRQAHQVWDELRPRLQGIPSWGDIEEAVRGLPTIDAHEFRVAILDHDCRESALQQLAMVTHLRGSFSEDLHEPERFISHARTIIRDESKDPALEGLLRGAALERFNPVVLPQALRGRDRILCDEFIATIQEPYFPPGGYGYSAHADALTLQTPEPVKESDFRYRFTGGAEGEIHRQLAARVNAKVLVPWPDTPDVPPTVGHQCVDSASSARSFFVARGVPADVYLIQVGALCHNVCVAFFEERGRLTPVVVDASPFEGSYSLTGEGRPTLWRPQLIENVYSVRKGGLPLVVDAWTGFFGRGSASPSGFLPWSCEDISEGRVVTFMGIHDRPVHAARCFERGTAEYYGRGERIRALGFSVSVIPPSAAQSPEAVIHLMTKWEEGELSVMECSEGLSEALRERLCEMLRAARPRAEETLARLNIPLGRLSW